MSNTTPYSQPITHRHRPGSIRAVLTYPDYRRMATASFLSGIGSWMQNVVLPVYILDRTDSTTLVGVMVFAQLGPSLLFSIPAGVIADRFDRKRWIMVTQTIQLVFSAALMPLAAADAPIWSIVAVSFCVGTGNSLTGPAWSAMLPTLVHRDDLSGSVALNAVSINGSRVIGPIIVAVLRTVGVTVPQIFLINAFTYLFVIGALLRTHLPHTPTHATESGIRQLTSGLRIVRAKPALSRLLLTMVTFSLLSLPFVGLFAAVVREIYGVNKGSRTYEWLYATWGLGAAFGGLAVGSIFVGLDFRRLVRATFTGFAVMLALFALGHATVWAFGIGFLLGFCYFATSTTINTLILERIEHHERGRVMSLWFMAFGGTVPLGNLMFAPVMDAIGPQPVLLFGAAWALGLAWFCNVGAIDRRLHEGPSHSVQPGDAAALHEHGISGGK